MRKIWFLLFLVLLQFAIAPPVSADSGAEDRVVFGGSVVIDENETVGGLTVLGGSATVLGEVTGDLVVFGGSAKVVGQVLGSMVVFGGEVDLKSASTVGKDIVNFGGVSPTGRRGQCRRVHRQKVRKTWLRLAWQL